MTALFLGLFVSGCIGYVLGNVKGNGGFGIALAVVLGPLGWLIVLCLPDARDKCPACGGALPDGKLTRCRHCGEALVKRETGAPMAKKPDPLEMWEAKEKSKTILEVPDHLRGRKVDED